MKLVYRALVVAWLIAVVLTAVGYVMARNWDALLWLACTLVWMLAATGVERTLRANQELLANVAKRYARARAGEIALWEHAERCSECPIEHRPDGDRLMVPVAQGEYVSRLVWARAFDPPRKHVQAELREDF